MLSVGFSSVTPGLRIVQVDEILEYVGCRQKGIKIAGFIIAHCAEDGLAEFGIWHRSKVDNFEMGSSNTLFGSNDCCMDIYRKISKERVGCINDKSLCVKLFVDDERGKISLSEKYQNARFVETTPAVSRFSNYEDEINPCYLPFTYNEIEFNAESDQYYVFYFNGEIREPAYNRLVIEDYLRGKRTYPVYGTDTVFRDIETIDLPRFEKFCSEFTRFEVARVYNEFFSKNHRIAPEYYSVISFDREPENNNLSAVLLNSKAQDISDTIDSSVKEKYGRVYWFVSNQNDQGFKIWLEGRMPDHDCTMMPEFYANRNATAWSLVEQVSEQEVTCCV